MSDDEIYERSCPRNVIHSEDEQVRFFLCQSKFFMSSIIKNRIMRMTVAAAAYLVPRLTLLTALTVVLMRVDLIKV